MKKNDLLKALKEAQNIEEGATNIYYEHLHALINSVIDDDPLIEKFHDAFKVLINGNQYHSKMCQELYKDIEKEKSDVI